ncbi:MAG: HlyD family secretion protein [Selenomonadaceae bacterium]
MKKNIKIIGVIVIGLLVIGGSVYYYRHHKDITTDDAAIDGRTVVLSPKVQGYIKAIDVEDNQLVKAGDVIMEIDPKDYELKVEQDKAALLSAQAALAGAENNLNKTTVTEPAGADAAQSQVYSAQATWEKNRTDRQRMGALLAVGACSQQEFDQAVAAEKSSKGTLDQMQANFVAANTAPSAVASSKNTVEQLKAKVQEAQIALEQAEDDLANTKIIASMDGRVANRSVEVGSYVTAGTQLGSLVGTELWVTANFKENQLSDMRQGDRVDIEVDAFPEIKLHGRLDSFKPGTGAHFSLFPAENATGNFVKTVQRVPVKIVIDPLAEDVMSLLGPGMSVEPVVHTGSRHE